MVRPKGAVAVLQTSPACSFGHSSYAGEPLDNELPGPGNKNPAPGEYNVSLKLTHTRAVTASLVGKGSHDPRRQQQPGPGQYSEAPAAATHPAPPAVSISHRLPGSREAERRPASGEYNPEEYRATSPLPVTLKHKRGVPAADRAESGHAVPGPVAYRPQDVMVNSRSSPLHTLGGRRHPASCTASLPGPTDYSPYLAGGRRPAGLGRAERYPASHFKVRSDPGSYFTHSVVTRQAGHSVESSHRSAPTLTIGTRQHVSCAASDNPGPGDYGVPKDGLLRASSPSFTFRGVAAKDHLVRNPGPGVYNPERHMHAVSTHASPPAVSISLRRPPPQFHNRQPGPGEYSPECCSTSQLPVTLKHKRGVSAADRADSGHAVPGPGEYKLPSMLGGHAHTMGAKLSSSRAHEQVPGPGEYHVHGSTLGVAGLS